MKASLRASRPAGARRAQKRRFVRRAANAGEEARLFSAEQLERQEESCAASGPTHVAAPCSWERVPVHLCVLAAC